MPSIESSPPHCNLIAAPPRAAGSAPRPGRWSAGRRRLGVGTVALAAVLTVAAGCATNRSPGNAGAVVVAAGPEVHERALLLLLADRRQFDGDVVQRALGGSAELRAELATTLGRIADPAALPTLETLLFSVEPEIRRAATFALGELADAGGATALLRAVSDPDREVGILAVEALGKLAHPLADVESALAAPRPGSLAREPLAAAEQRERLLPHLFRFREERTVAVATAALADVDLATAAPALWARAAYALCRDPQPAALEAIRGLLAAAGAAPGSSPGAFVRGAAARALGMVGDADDVARLATLLEDPAPGPTIQALRALRRLVREGKVGSPAGWAGRLSDLLADPRPGVRMTAIEAAAGWLGAPEVGEVVLRLATGGSGRERELALAALVEAGDPRAPLLLAQAATSVDAVLRARVAEGLAKLPAGDPADVLLHKLALDTDAGVRTAALAGRLERCGAGGPAVGEESAPASGRASGPAVPPECAELARAALADADPVVRATALDWAKDHPVLPLELLAAAFTRSLEDRALNDARLAAVDALAARAKAEVLERGGAIAALEPAARDRDVLVRRRAVAALGGLGSPAPAVGPVDTGRGLGVYREILSQTATPRRVELVTTRGSVRIELACPEAPLTCLNFLQLARSGYFDGLAFHRVVPDFVVQGGDPRGDGSGGPGYAIRDEINPLRYDRGAVGMALAGPDSGGSQFFVTLSEQPHLDGGYTVFGRVTSGLEVLDSLVQGERILRVVEVGGR